MLRAGLRARLLASLFVHWPFIPSTLQICWMSLTLDSGVGTRKTIIECVIKGAPLYYERWEGFPERHLSRETGRKSAQGSGGRPREEGATQEIFCCSEAQVQCIMALTEEVRVMESGAGDPGKS